MAQEIAFENGQISNFEGLLTLTLTLNQVILHTIDHRASFIDLYPHANLTEIRETFCGRTDGRTDGRKYVHSYACTYTRTYTCVRTYVKV